MAKKPAVKDLNINNDEKVDLFDEALIEGLEVDGRSMTTDDILSGVMKDGVVTIVTCDGKKHTIAQG